MPGEVVLDAGCGTGYGTKLLALVAKKAIGYDVDEGCIKQTLREKPHLDNVEFKAMDLDKCELPGVDVAVSIETIEHLNDMHHFVDELHKKVRRLIVVTVPLGGTVEAYKDWPPGPATEKNDFMTKGDVDKLLAPEGSEWQTMTGFSYGYSHFGVYFKKPPKMP